MFDVEESFDPLELAFGLVVDFGAKDEAADEEETDEADEVNGLFGRANDFGGEAFFAEVKVKVVVVV